MSYIDPLILSADYEDKGNLYGAGYGHYEREEFKKAFECFRKAAKQGNIHAQDMLAWMLYNGKGVEKDYEKSFFWFERAAKENNIRAQYMLGHMYYLGEGVEKDHVEAFLWYVKAADQFYADAQYMVGVMYRDGTGVNKNRKKAMQYFASARDRGHSHAKEKYDIEKRKILLEIEGPEVRYEEDEEEKKDEKETNQIEFTNKLDEGVSAYKHGDYQTAYELWNHLAGSGLAEAQYCLAILHETGKGVRKDFRKAVYWYKRAEKQGSIKATLVLKTMELEKKYAENTIKPPEQLQLAEELENQGKFKRALVIAEDLYSKNPENETVRLLVERIQKKLNSGEND